MNTEEKVKFKEKFITRFLFIKGISKEKMDASKHWRKDFPLSRDECSELIEFGVEDLIATHGMNRSGAESEVSWFLIEVGFKYDQ